jgi:hypothetical protein
MQPDYTGSMTSLVVTNHLPENGDSDPPSALSTVNGGYASPGCASGRCSWTAR